MPFAFVNVALWARPGVVESSRAGRLSAYLVRLLAVSLTVSLVLAAAGVGMDQIGWPGRDGCRTVPGTGFLSGGFWGTGLRPVVVGMLAPVLLLLVMVVLARRSFAYEATTATTRPAPSGGKPFEHHCFWAGEGQVRRLPRCTPPRPWPRSPAWRRWPGS